MIEDQRPTCLVLAIFSTRYLITLATEWNSGAGPFRRFNPPLSILTTVIDLSFPDLKLDQVRKLAVIAESRRIGPYPLPSWETNLSNKFQLQDGDSFWLTIAKSFSSLKCLFFVLNKVKVANLRQLALMEPEARIHYAPTLRNALRELQENSLKDFNNRVSQFEHRESDGYWWDMTLDCMIFVEEMPTYHQGTSIPDYTSWI